MIKKKWLSDTWSNVFDIKARAQIFLISQISRYFLCFHKFLFSIEKSFSYFPLPHVSTPVTNGFQRRYLSLLHNKHGLYIAMTQRHQKHIRSTWNCYIRDMAYKNFVCSYSIRSIPLMKICNKTLFNSCKKTFIGNFNSGQQHWSIVPQIGTNSLTLSTT